MLVDKDIIVFSDDWGRHPSSCQHLFRQLIPLNRVIWVNTIGMRSPKFSFYDIKRCFEILLKWIFSLKNKDDKQHENLCIVNPVIIPFNEYSIIRNFNKKSVLYKIKKILHKDKISECIVVTTFPSTSDYIDFFVGSLVVYYCVDDFVNWPGVDADLIAQLENDLIRKSDLVLATSEHLCDSKTREGKIPHLLAHGVDFEHFHSALSVIDKPLAAQGITGPIIGFFGSLSAWLDFDLILFLAKERPSWSFVYIGPADTDISAIANVDNIYLLGKIPYEQLPNYAVSFDVGIIPFQINELTAAVNPLKLFEYLSIGIPVVSTFMPDLVKYTDLVTLCQEKQDFLQSIDNAIEHDSIQLRQQRIDIAKGHSWRSVAKKFSDICTNSSLGTNICMFFILFVPMRLL